MNTNYVDAHKKIILDNLSGFFEEHLVKDPVGLLDQLERELRSLYVRQGNDWTGRGEIGDAKLEATIAVLEAMRAECLEQLKYQKNTRRQL